MAKQKEGKKGVNWLKNLEKMFDDYKELIDLLPAIQEASLKGMERGRKNVVYTTERVRVKANLYREIFKLIQGKWTIEIIYSLMMLEACNFNELKRILPGINSRTLTDRLRFLEHRKILSRTVLTTSPIRVEYKLTEGGKELFALLIPFITFYILPKSIKESLPKFKSIEEGVQTEIAQEVDNLVQ